MREIPLTKNKVAVVDDEDYERIAQFKWHSVCMGLYRKIWYAVRDARDGEQMEIERIYMHREIMGATPGVEIDHRNGDGLDNRKQNLRPATHAQNIRNRYKQKRYACAVCSSRFKGVGRHKSHGTCEPI